MARSEVHPVHKFESWQVWPGSFHNPPPNGVFPAPANISLKINRSTAIASMGSCFAREIKRRLLQLDYNYITEETGHPASGTRQRRMGTCIQHPRPAPDIRIYFRRLEAEGTLVGSAQIGQNPGSVPPGDSV